jgi:hypothetical protein
MDNPEETELVAVPIEWHIPEGIVPGYATNLAVQHTEHEFTIYFFRAGPPLIVGSPEEKREQAKKLKSIRAECVAQVIVSASRMPEFVEVLQKNVQQHAAKFLRSEESNE